MLQLRSLDLSVPRTAPTSRGLTSTAAWQLTVPKGPVTADLGQKFFTESGLNRKIAYGIEIMRDGLFACMSDRIDGCWRMSSPVARLDVCASFQC
jgi:hypothetical protein